MFTHVGFLIPRVQLYLYPEYKRSVTDSIAVRRLKKPPEHVGTGPDVHVTPVLGSNLRQRLQYTRWCLVWVLYIIIVWMASTRITRFWYVCCLNRGVPSLCIYSWKERVVLGGGHSSSGNNRISWKRVSLYWEISVPSEIESVVSERITVVFSGGKTPSAKQLINTDVAVLDVIEIKRSQGAVNLP